MLTSFNEHWSKSQALFVCQRISDLNTWPGNDEVSIEKIERTKLLREMIFSLSFLLKSDSYIY